MNYTKVLNSPIPQSQEIPGEQQIKNSAGGFVYKATDGSIVERFLLLGTEGGTYYASEQKLTLDTAKTIINQLKFDGLNVLTTLQKYSEGNRLPKQDTALFVLALATVYGNPLVKRRAYELIPVVARTATNLFSFLSMVTPLRGWSRGLRNAVASFYTNRTVDQLAYQVLKYKNRNGWSHSDAIRLSHPVPTSDEMSALFRYVLGKHEPIGHRPMTTDLPGLVEDYELVHNLSSLDRKLAVLSGDSKLTWEMLPSELLKEPTVWSTLLKGIPYTALLRNLSRLTSLSMFDDKSNVALVVSKLTNLNDIKRSRVHPIAILNSMVHYSKGQGDKGSLTWTPNQKVMDALDEALTLASGAQEPSGKDILVAVDVSGSMQNQIIAGMNLRPSNAAAVLASTMLKSDPGCELAWFNTKAVYANVGRRTSYEEILKTSESLGGGTDCASPFKLAYEHKKRYDAFVILTDNQTWAGGKHPVQAFREYQRLINKDAKVIVVCMATNEFNLFDANDPSALQIAGLDTNVPQIIAEFIK